MKWVSFYSIWPSSCRSVCLAIFSALFNSVGLIGVSALLLWQAIERLLHPVPIQGAVPVIVGLSAAGANWRVARLLLKPAQNNAGIRLPLHPQNGRCRGIAAPATAGRL